MACFIAVDVCRCGNAKSDCCLPDLYIDSLIYADEEELPDKERKEMMRHIETCSECAYRYQDFQRDAKKSIKHDDGDD